MISSRIFKYGLLSKLWNRNLLQYRELRRTNKIVEHAGFQNEKLNIQEIKHENLPEVNCKSKALFPSSNKENSSDLSNKFLDENLLTETDKQSKELLKHVPKSNYAGTFNLAAYINESETLQQLQNLGVDLSKIEKRKGLGQFVLQLDFEKNIKSHLIFLHDIGVPANFFGEFLTKNPLIFRENLDDLQTRINYLDSKQFKTNQIQRICTLNPFWLMFSATRIDKRLGYFQQNFKLTGDDTRHLATKQPRLITYKMDHIRENTFCIKEEMGFQGEEIKCLLLSKPKLWMMNREEIIERFDYIHNTMKLSHEIILLYPEILTSRLFRIKERHQYLQSLGKVHNDINEAEFISPKKLVAGTDKDFVENVCQTSITDYESFLRNL